MREPSSTSDGTPPIDPVETAPTPKEFAETISPEGRNDGHDPRERDVQMVRRRVRGAFRGHVEEFPARIGRFVVLRVLGQGGMGRVYAAFDEQLDRRVAVKVLRTFREGVDETSRVRVLREAKAMAKLSHANVVQVFEVGEHDHELFVAMEFIRGQTLADWQTAPERRWKEVLDAYLQAGEGLAAAHAEGLVHRDFKPQNAMVDARQDGRLRVRVLDFGLARLTTAPSSPQDSLISEGIDGVVADAKLTATGNMLGTPAYMAPEQFATASVGEAADQFSFCVALWEGLYGERPFDGATVPELFHAIASGNLREPPRSNAVPGWVRDAVIRGLSAQAERRHPSMHELLATLRRDPAQRRHRWVRIGAFALAIAAVGAGVQAWTTARAERCSGAAQQLDGVWDPARRAEVQQAIVGTGLAYAEGAWRFAAAELDRYADEWKQMHIEACTATTIRGEQSQAVMDLRMICLDRARQQLRAATAVLADADADVVRNAAKVVSGLASLERCADTSALQAEVEPPLPEEAESVEHIRTLLAQASAERKAGRYAAAQQSVAQAEQRLVDVEYPPVHTEVALENGIVLRLLAQYEAAEAALRDALGRAAQSNQRDAMQEAAIELMFVVGYFRREMESGLQLRELARGLADDPRQEANARHIVSALLLAQGKYAEAATEQRQVIALREQALGAEHPQVASAMDGLGAALSGQGKYAEAEAQHRRALTLIENALGADHPLTASLRNNLATVLHQQGKEAEAERELRQALALQETVLGAEHPDVAAGRDNLGAILRAQGKYPEAEAEHRRAFALFEKAFGAEHPKLAMSTTLLGLAMQAQGDYADAEAEYQRALTLFEKTLGPDHPEVAGAWHNLGVALLQQGKDEAAEQKLRRAVTLGTKALGAEHREVLDSRIELAVALAGQKKYAEAEADFRRALPLLEKVLGPEHSTVAMARTYLAETLLERGQRREALELAEQAWILRERAGVPPDAQANTAFVLARALWASGSDAQIRGRARELAQRALDGYSRAGRGHADEAASVRTWLEVHGL